MSGFLVVDDSPTVRVVLSEAIAALRGRGKVQEADRPATAVDAFMNGAFEAVFLDLNLDPESAAADGVDVLRSILTEDPRARVIVLTGLPQDHPDVIEAISLGAFAYVRKPVRRSEIKQVMQDLDTERGSLGRVN